MPNKHTYKIVMSGVDYTGWFKFWLLRNDGKEIKVTRARVAQLRKEGRITVASDCEGDLRNVPVHLMETK